MRRDTLFLVGVLVGLLGMLALYGRRVERRRSIKLLVRGPEELGPVAPAPVELATFDDAQLALSEAEAA